MWFLKSITYLFILGFILYAFDTWLVSIIFVFYVCNYLNNGVIISIVASRIINTLLFLFLQ